MFFKKRWVYHLLIWISLGLFISLALADQKTEHSTSVIVLNTFVRLIPMAIATYGNFYFRDKFFLQRRYWTYGLMLLLTLTFCVALSQVISIVLPLTYASAGQELINMGTIVLVAMGLQYLKRGIIVQYQLQELKAKTVQSELDVLKAQINPHFLFNTLNNIYAINQVDPNKGSEMILELSDTMRYHLLFSKSDQVELEDELKLIQSYIALERLRITDNCEVSLKIGQVKKNTKIAPLIFLPFVENAFKHGMHPNQKSFILIELFMENETLFFGIENSVIKNKKVVKTNIGIANVKRRLQIIYPDKHSLKVKHDIEVYSVDLSILL